MTFESDLKRLPCIGHSILVDPKCWHMPGSDGIRQRNQLFHSAIYSGTWNKKINNQKKKRKDKLQKNLLCGFSHFSVSNVTAATVPVQQFLLPHLSDKENKFLITQCQYKRHWADPITINPLTIHSFSPHISLTLFLVYTLLRWPATLNSEVKPTKKF